MPNIKDGYAPKNYNHRKRTKENWHPTRKDGTITVLVFEGVDEDGEVTSKNIRILGEDGHSLILSFPYDTITFWCCCLIADSLPEPITYAELERLGFKRD